MTKHGAPLSSAPQIDWESVGALADHRFEVRDGTVHVISPRKANKREVQQYESKA